MRRKFRALLLLCTGFAVFSCWYTSSTLFSSSSDTEVPAGGRTWGSPPHPPEGTRSGSRTGAQGSTPHRYHRYIMRQRGQVEPGGGGGGDPIGVGGADVGVGGAISPPPPVPSRRPEAPSMHLAVVACGDRLEETVTMVKSAVLLSDGELRLHVFAEEQLHAGFRDTLEAWPAWVRSRFRYTLHPISFPSDRAAEWRTLFKPCASQRLFLPLILQDVDSLAYVDSDVVFLRAPQRLWSLLARFDAAQLAAAAPEHEEPRVAWYNRFARHPYYGATGLNSGVMLMNLTRIRSAYFKNDMTSVGLRWEELLMPLLQKYRLNITWGDQDLLNIIFHHNPEYMLEFPCQWNYRPDHCMYGSNCAAAERDGVHVLHGNRGVFHDRKQPAFRAVYDAIRQGAAVIMTGYLATS